MIRRSVTAVNGVRTRGKETVSSWPSAGLTADSHDARRRRRRRDEGERRSGRVTKADGSHVTVILDKDFTVLTVETHP